MIVEVKVTKNNINNGVRCESLKCPLALAIKPFIAKDYDIQVGVRDVGIYYKNDINEEVKEIDLPKIALDFRSDFDNCRDLYELPFKPFSFKLNIPKKYLKSKYHVPAASKTNT